LIIWKRLNNFGLLVVYVYFIVRVHFTNKKEDGSATSCRLVCCEEGIKKKEKKNAYEEKY